MPPLRRSSIVALLAALLVSGFMASRAPDTPVGDERGFLYYGTMQAELYLSCLRGEREACQDWRWTEAYDGYGSRNPKLGLYLLGAVDHATRGLPVEQRVRAMRLIWGGMAALCVWLLALLGGGRHGVAGLVAAGLLLLHPVFRASQVALLPDVPMLLFILWALLCVRQGLQASRGRKAGLLLAAGALLGLGVACKLYALAGLGAVATMLLVHRRSVGWRGCLGFGLGLVIGAAVFAGSNPYLWQQPTEALRAMTTGHVLAQQGALAGAGTWLSTLGYLAWLPFSLPVEPILDSRTQLQGLEPGWSLWVGGALGALGLFGAIRRRRWLPVLFLLSSFGLAAWVVTRFDAAWLYPRALLLPSVAVAWLGSSVVDLLPRKWGL